MRLASKWLISLLLMAAALWLARTAFATESPAAGDEGTTPSDKIDFVRDIQPILVQNCYRCHGPTAAKGKLRLDQRDSTMKRDEAVIVPGHLDKSPLLDRVAGTDPDEAMPPKGKGDPLTSAQVATLKRWVEQGADWPDIAAQGPDPRKEHWAFKKPVRPALPEVTDTSWPRNEIDRFILARLEKEGLHPAPEADRYTLVRRVTEDLTGLPPTLAEVDAFVKEDSADAYDKLVDRLLASPHYGERWAQVWLDLARYADSKGYAEDNPRTIWKYRDWVIQAINENKPYDQFTIEQIAGDLLPDATPDQLIATAFHRNTLTNDEGGTDDEEFRTAAVVDRVNTTFQVFTGLTMACAECHDHKYDPITQKEYFGAFAIFNQTEDADRRDELPVLASPTPAQQVQIERLNAKIARLEAEKRELAERKPTTEPATQPTTEPSTKPTRDAKAIDADIAAAKKRLAAVPVVTTPVMRELPADKRRKTQMFFRGNFLDKGPPATETVPAFLNPLRERPINRLALARWLVSEDNPLTARVTVNRYWEQLFGTGIVETGEDFGVRCSPPSHPELLDWLATELVHQGWDTKAIVRLIVTSAAYRQSSKVSTELLEEDPANRLLTRGPRVRVPAEMVRDQALFVAGLLSPKMYGPPARPPQPKFGMKAAFGQSADWQDSTGDERYRRGLYTSWRRSSPYPSAVTFDAPDRNVCTVRRTRTNTPLQSLVTLNDPVYVEAAQALGRRMVKEGGDSTESRLTYGFRLCLARPPEQRELNRLVKLFDNARERFADEPDKAKKLATDPIGKLPKDADPAEMAAWTVVGNVLLNVDEMFLKR